MIKSERIGEAVFFARAYAPSKLPEVMIKWNENLKQNGLPFKAENIEVSREEYANEM